MFRVTMSVITVLFGLPAFVGCDTPVNVRRTDDTPATSIAMAPKSSLDPWKVAMREMESLCYAPADEFDNEGRMIAFSMRFVDKKAKLKGVSLSELAASENAKNLERLTAHSADLTDEDMAYLAEFPNLKYLELNVNPKITDQGLQHLKGLKELRYLSLFYCPELTGSGFEYLTKLEKLVNLNISNNQISDKHLSQLQKINSLQVLNVDPNTDQGMAELSRFSSLRRLWIGGKQEQLTDAGLEKLSSLSNLEILMLPRDKYSEEAIAQLKQSLPDCRIQQ